MRILLTGGAGYIGSHTAVELLHAGFEVVIVDNLSNSNRTVIDRIRHISGKDVSFHEADLRDLPGFISICKNEKVEAVIHFAGLKAVAESVKDPLRYYEENLLTSINLCHGLKAAGIRKLIFSSSATVYGEPEQIPITEECLAISASNPYGRTKIFIEQMLTDVAAANPEMSIALLRYFNPGGAHASGLIGEDPRGIPANLIPFLTQVATGMRDDLVIFGDDYPTPDGTCIRDYIHVTDLAQGHIAALRKVDGHTGVFVCNLGTGVGHSVLEVIAAFEKATNQHIPRRTGPRRVGDVPVSFTDVSRARRELDWQANKSIVEICQDAWHWQEQNPEGYGS
jgi:UDP-glucose 4-epimerase